MKQPTRSKPFVLIVTRGGAAAPRRRRAAGLVQSEHFTAKAARHEAKRWVNCAVERIELHDRKSGERFILAGE